MTAQDVIDEANALTNLLNQIDRLLQVVLTQPLRELTYRAQILQPVTMI